MSDIAFNPDEWQTETRPCSDCVNFRSFGFGEIPMCRKKLFSVASSLRIKYKKEEGTCFEWKDHEMSNETIICPACNKTQQAEVEIKWPYASFTHICDCGYVIMESEWVRASNEGRLRQKLESQGLPNAQIHVQWNMDGPASQETIDMIAEMAKAAMKEEGRPE